MTQKPTTTKKSKAKVQLTLEQRRKILLTPCRTREEAKNWIKYHLGLELPDQTVSRFADTNPLDSIWEMYDVCVNDNNPENIQELLYVAGRGSGKCSKKDTLILTSSGPKYIQNVVVGDEVWTGLSWKPVTHTFDEGMKQGVELKTKVSKYQGSIGLTGSMRHRVQAVTENGLINWVYMRDLKPGQLIYKSDQRLKCSVTSSEFNDGWLVGVITGDGCVARQSQQITVTSSDFQMLRHYTNLLRKKFGINHKVHRISKKAVDVFVSNKEFRQWFHSYIEGELSYDKKLISLEHSPSFLAGFIAGLMDTDGSKDGITLANPKLVAQIGSILAIFGVHSSINHSRHPPRFSQFIQKEVTYSECMFKSRLPENLMPLFAKRQAFKVFHAKINEQFRYPSSLIKPFAEYIKEKYEIANGYWRLAPGKKTHSTIKYSKDLWGAGEKSKEGYVYGYKIDYFIELAKSLNEQEWVDRLQFIRNGYYEVVDSITFQNDYFYDLEVADDHAYWSNGFISHNTLCVAIAELMILLHDQRDVVHVGAILSQAKRCYEYQTSFLLNDKLSPILNFKQSGVPILEKTNMEKSIFNLTDRLTGEGIKVTLEVLPCTLKSVNGPHVALVSVDEIDTVSGEGLRAFKDISGMLDSKRGRKALRVGISTRKSRYGLMNQQIESAEASGRTVRRWTALEFSQRCPDERSGTQPTLAYVKQDTMEVISPEAWKQKGEQQKAEFVANTFPGEKCVGCPMGAVCLGDAKKQASPSKMLKPISDAIKKTMENGADWTMSQLYNLKPSVEGIIFKEFDEKVHVKEWNEMWKILVGKEYPGECTHDIFVRKCNEMGLPCYAGIDWGWSNPSTVVYFYVDSRENIYVVRCDGMTYVSNPTWIAHLKSKWHHMYRCQLYFPDMANPGDAFEMRKAGLPTAGDVEKGNIMGGVQVIKKWLRTPGLADTKIFFARETCGHIVQEFNLYHFKTDAAGQVTEDPDTEYDHWLDALRYPMAMLFGKSSIILSSAGLDFDRGSVVDSGGNFYRAPNAAEFASALNIPVNTSQREETVKLGKLGSISQLEKEEDDCISGDGAFLWSFG